MNIPDPIELGETSMERWAEDNMRGDRFLCGGCGLWVHMDQATQSSPNPYAPPICWACCEKSEPDVKT